MGVRCPWKYPQGMFREGGFRRLKCAPKTPLVQHVEFSTKKRRLVNLSDSFLIFTFRTEPTIASVVFSSQTQTHVAMCTTNQTERTGPLLRPAAAIYLTWLGTGSFHIYKYFEAIQYSHQPLLYICSFSVVNFVRGRWFIWRKGRGGIVRFSKTVSPSSRGVGGRWFYSIIGFFCNGRQSVIKRSCHKEITWKELFGVESIQTGCVNILQPWSKVLFLSTPFFNVEVPNLLRW